MSKELLLNLLDARIPVELRAVALAAAHAGEENLEEMRRLLAHAGRHLQDPEVLTPTNLGFHQQIAIASGDAVLKEIITVLAESFQDQQREILDIYRHWRKDYMEHLGILQALEARNVALAVERMHAHLQGVREVLARWEPDAPASGKTSTEAE